MSITINNTTYSDSEAVALIKSLNKENDALKIEVSKAIALIKDSLNLVDDYKKSLMEAFDEIRDLKEALKNAIGDINYLNDKIIGGKNKCNAKDSYYCNHCPLHCDFGCKWKLEDKVNEAIKYKHTEDNDND
jgi:hypothetical protein